VSKSATPPPPSAAPHDSKSTGDTHKWNTRQPNVKFNYKSQLSGDFESGRSESMGGVGVAKPQVSYAIQL